MSSPAQRLRASRQARWRQRQRCGAAVIAVEVKDYYKLVDALIVTGAVSTGDALDRQKVTVALGEMLAAWSHEWAK